MKFIFNFLVTESLHGAIQTKVGKFFYSDKEQTVKFVLSDF